MSRAVVLSAVRTPVGRYGGVLAGERPDDLAAAVITAAVERAGVARARSRTSSSAAANQAGEDNRNVARMAVLLAGLPESVAGVTVNRLCASGLSAVVAACHAIAAGDGDLFVAGGVESMSRAPLVTGEAGARPSRAGTRPSGTRRSAGASRTRAWRSCSRSSRWARPARTSPSATASAARSRTRSRSRSQQRWAAAAEAGRFDDELVPVGDAVRDEHPRPDTSAEKLAALKPAFRAGRHGHGRELERDQRRRRRARDRERGEGAGARRRAARRVRRLVRSRASTRA